MKPIAVIRTDFPNKFGLPRQSGLVPQLKGRIVFEPEYRDINAFRGILEYSHLWLIWEFSDAKREGWSPTVRPPRLGGNVQMGVFATRSPFRPNPLGLSVVRLEELVVDAVDGPVLVVGGVDMKDGTPIYDIKPYLPHVDSVPDAKGGFAAEVKDYALNVVIPDAIAAHIPEEKREGLLELLRQDPRPGYKREDTRVFGFAYAGLEVRFRVADGVLTVCEVEGSGL